MAREKQLEALSKYGIFIGFFAVVLLAFLFVILTPYWWLALVAGAIGGFFVVSTKTASRVGFLGVIAAWVIFLLIKIALGDILELIDMIGAIIIGGAGNGWIILLLIMIVGGSLGALGAYFGSALRGLLLPSNIEDPKSKQ